MKIASCAPDAAEKYLSDMHRINFVRKFDFAILVRDEDRILGAIGMYADGEECKLGHLYTNGGELVGSILYGAAWRAAKALGYKQITL